LALTEQGSEQGLKRSRHRNAYTWVKGQSGNPKGKRLEAERNTEQREKTEAKAEQVFREIQADFDNLTALESTLARQAAVNLALAHFSLNVDIRARLLGSAGRILDKRQRAVAARRAAQPLPSLQELGL